MPRPPFAVRPVESSAPPVGRPGSSPPNFRCVGPTGAGDLNTEELGDAVTRLEHVPEIEANGVVVSEESDHIGYVRRVLLNADTGHIACVTVFSGWRRHHECFIPLDNAVIQLNEIRVPYDRKMVKRAPRAEIQHLAMTDAHALLLLGYYGVTADMVTRIANFAEYRAPESDPAAVSDPAAEAELEPEPEPAG